MYEKIINNMGLSQVQSEILNSLLLNGEDKASNIAKKIKRPRGVAYKGLDELIELKLVSKRENKKGITIYRAEHPNNLENLIEKREKEFKKEKQEFINNLPDLVSAYSLISNKPGVRFYEGEEGVKKSLNDTLNAQEVVYTYADIEAVEKNLKEINDEYVKNRERKGIIKKVIVADTKFNRSFLKKLKNETTEIRFLSDKFYNFNTGMQIYDNKTSYQVISVEKKLAVIIEDENIYKMQRYLFEFIWSKLEN